MALFSIYKKEFCCNSDSVLDYIRKCALEKKVNRKLKMARSRRLANKIGAVMATEYSILRSHLLEYIRRGISDRHAQFEVSSIRNFLESKGVNPDEDVNDWPTIQQIIHELYVEGIINPGQKIRPHITGTTNLLGFPLFHVTAYGEKVLENTEYQPHDQDGYLQKIKTEISIIDPVIIRYLEECLSCFRRNLLLSSAVMLGCASEKAVLLLIETFGATLQGAQKTAFEKETNTFIISRKYKSLWSRLEPISKSLPDNLGDNLESIIHNTFDIIRTTRNDAGHPSGNIIEKETVHANLLLFPIFCKRIYKLIDYFSAS